jgi:hypothetical protein
MGLASVDSLCTVLLYQLALHRADAPPQLKQAAWLALLHGPFQFVFGDSSSNCLSPLRGHIEFLDSHSALRNWFPEQPSRWLVAKRKALGKVLQRKTAGKANSDDVKADVNQAIFEDGAHKPIAGLKGETVEELSPSAWPSGCIVSEHDVRDRLAAAGYLRRVGTEYHPSRGQISEPFDEEQYGSLTDAEARDRVIDLREVRDSLRDPLDIATFDWRSGTTATQSLAAEESGYSRDQIKRRAADIRKRLMTRLRAYM